MPQNKPRILIMSMRGCNSQAFRSSEYEFEDAICSFDDVDILIPVLNYNLHNIAKKKIANCLGTVTGKGKFLNSGCQTSIITQKYDFFFFICQHFWDITYINAIKGWRKNCQQAVLWIDEIWVKEIGEHKTKICLELLKDFDYIFTTQSGSVEAIANIIQRPCYSLPYGVDTIKFCPYPHLSERTVDIYSIGRRSSVVHKNLLKLAESKNYLYVYDTLKGLQMIDYKEHRTLYSNLIKRSRYFIANKAKFDAIYQTGNQEELGSRFFEGAAGGTVMIGTPPICQAYQENFNWLDAVIKISNDGSNICDIIAELDTQTERIKLIRKNNIVNSLLRHDWVYRWEKILKKVGLDITKKMLCRKSYLHNLAEIISE